MSSTSHTARDAIDGSSLGAGARRVGRADGERRAARVRAGAVRPPAVRAVLVGDHRPAQGDRPRPGGDPPRTSQEPRAELGSRSRRPADVVLHDGLDDVERPRLDAAHRRIDRDARRQSAAPRCHRAVASRGRGRGNRAGRQPGVSGGLSQVGRPTRGPYAGLRLRELCTAGAPLPPDAAAWIYDELGRRPPVDERQRRYGRVHGDRAGQPAAAGVGRGHLRSVSRRGDGGLRPRRPAGRRRARRTGDHRADAVDARRVLERPRRQALPGDVLRPLSRRLATGRLGAVLRERQLCRHRPVRRHAQPRWRAPRDRRVLPSCRRVRRSAEQPRRAPRGSRRRARRADSLRGPRRSDRRRTTPCSPSIGHRLRSELSPRHVPDDIVRVDAIPVGLTGKKLELPVKRILQGANVDEVASRDALVDPSSLDPFVEFAAGRRS